MKFDPKKLKQIRKEHKKTQKDLGKALEMEGHSGYQKKETGEIATTLKQLKILCKFYSIDLSEFFVFDGKENIFRNKPTQIIDARERFTDLGRDAKEILALMNDIFRTGDDQDRKDIIYEIRKAHRIMQEKKPFPPKKKVKKT